ncbi:MAG TPA: hypothetical protein VHZ28_15120 [Terracidiphilus sp.]|jgi:hypothetical protein|nr:hypothetical protein [Terracidiphilus sp.]
MKIAASQSRTVRLWSRYAASAALLCVAFLPVTSQQPNQPRNVPEFINRLPDANDQARMRQTQKTQADFAAANALRQKEIAGDTEKLQKLANDLKADVDKAGPNTLSLNALRKADAIEKLAHNIKLRMTVTVGTS